MAVSHNLGVRIDDQSNFYFWNLKIDSFMKKSPPFSKMNINKLFASPNLIFGVGESGSEDWA